MKKYTKPKIQSVRLNPEQAILQVCKVGGVYIWTATRCGSTGPIVLSCTISIKGVRERGHPALYTNENQSS